MSLRSRLQALVAPQSAELETIVILGELISRDSPLFALASALQLATPAIRGNAISSAIAEMAKDLVAQSLTSPEAWELVHRLHEQPAYRETVWDAIWRRTLGAGPSEQQEILLRGLQAASEVERPILASLYAGLLARLWETRNSPELFDAVILLRRITTDVEADGTGKDRPWSAALERIDRHRQSLPIPACDPPNETHESLPRPADGREPASKNLPRPSESQNDPILRRSWWRR